MELSWILPNDNTFLDFEYVNKQLYACMLDHLHIYYAINRDILGLINQL